MQSIDAALAFAITMLVLAMVVTTIVETVHRILGLREKGLALMLCSFYDRVLARHCGREVGDIEGRRRFVEMMTVNRGPVGAAPFMPTMAFVPMPYRDARSEDRKFLNRIWSGRRLNSLNLTSFMERLGSSEFGSGVVNRAPFAGEKGVEWLLKDIAQKFDAFGQEASEYFERRARLLSVVAGIVLAFVLNVNAFTLFDTYMKRPDLTQAVIAHGDELSARYQQLQSQVTELNNAAAKAREAANGERVPFAPVPGNVAENQADKATEPDSVRPLSTERDVALIREVEDARDSVQRAADEAAAAVQELHTLGVPIGWSAQRTAELRRSPVSSLFGLLLGGLLVGLGAPFWFRAVQGVTGIRKALGGFRETTPGATEASAAQAADVSAREVPRTPIESFHAALGAALVSRELGPPEDAVG